MMMLKELLSIPIASLKWAVYIPHKLWFRCSKVDIPALDQPLHQKLSQTQSLQIIKQ